MGAAGTEPAAPLQTEQDVISRELIHRGYTTQFQFGETVSINPDSLDTAKQPSPPLPQEVFDVFLSHAHPDAEIVEKLGIRLRDEVNLKVWLDKWILVPGEHWQQEMARGLDRARTCAVCIGTHTPQGWFREEIERALNKQVRDKTFRVIPVILPGGDHTIINNFLELRTWVDFKNGIHDHSAFHILVSGIRGISPGRNPKYNNSNIDTTLTLYREKLLGIQILRESQLIDKTIVLECQKKIMDRFIEL